MTDCIHRKFVVRGTHMMCGHTESNARGIHPLSVCETCVLRRLPGDFFAQTERLLIKKQTAGEYVPQPRECRSCPGTVLERKAGPTLQFVWCYWDGGADGEELRFSIRSVEKFFQGTAKITIIGDRPEWFKGHVIVKRRVPASRHQREFRDMLGKVWFMATHPEVDDKCVWMMDDIYFIKPFTLKDLEKPRAERWNPSSKNRWQRIKSRTMQDLQAEGLPTHDYATHAPHVAEKQKLAALFERFNLHKKVRLWEVLYGNVYRGTPRSARPWFARFYDQLTADQYANRLTQATCFNHTAGAWCKGLFEYLSTLLPEPSSAETGKPAYRRVRKQAGREVLQRQWYTTRSYKESIAMRISASESSRSADTVSTHAILIQSCYQPQHAALSRYRLDLARLTVIPSLRMQTRKPVVHMAVCPDDVYLQERIEAFQTTGCELKFIHRPSWKLYRERWELPAGRKVVSRCDDDDVLSIDFCQRVFESAPAAGEWAIIWPNGHVFWRSELYKLDHPGNQFVSIVTDQDRDPHQQKHVDLFKQWQTVVAEEKAAGWIWVRHAAAVSSTLQKYRTKKIGRIDSDRFPVNLRAIERLVQQLPPASGNYATHQPALQE